MFRSDHAPSHPLRRFVAIAAYAEVRQLSLRSFFIACHAASRLGLPHFAYAGYVMTLDVIYLVWFLILSFQLFLLLLSL